MGFRVRTGRRRVSAAALETYCVVCDAIPGDCGHGGARYLEGIDYERVENDAGMLTGWQVPALERERFENGSGMIAGKPEVGTPRPVGKLIVALEQWVYLDDRLERAIRSSYELEQAKVTRLVDYTIDQARAGKLKNPGAFLASRVKEIANKN